MTFMNIETTAFNLISEASNMTPGMVVDSPSTMPSNYELEFTLFDASDALEQYESQAATGDDLAE